MDRTEDRQQLFLVLKKRYWYFMSSIKPYRSIREEHPQLFFSCSFMYLQEQGTLGKLTMVVFPQVRKMGEQIWNPWPWLSVTLLLPLWVQPPKNLLEEVSNRVRTLLSSLGVSTRCSSIHAKCLLWAFPPSKCLVAYPKPAQQWALIWSPMLYALTSEF